MFLRIEEPDSSRESSDEDASRTNEETMLRKAKSDKDLFTRKSRALNGDVCHYADKESSFRQRRSQDQQPKRNIRADTEMSAMEVIESMLIEGVKSANNNLTEEKFDLGQCRDTESAASRSFVESLRDSLIVETKKRKDLEFSLELKDRMITELKLQNELYEKINNQSPQPSILTPIAQKEIAALGLEPKKPIRKPNVETFEKRATERFHERPVRHHPIVTRREPRETDMMPKKHEITVKHHEQNEVSLQNARYKKLVKTFGDTLSKLARKQVARDGKESKDLRELWDVWNRLIRDVT